MAFMKFQKRIQVAVGSTGNTADTPSRFWVATLGKLLWAPGGGLLDFCLTRENTTTETKGY